MTSNKNRNVIIVGKTGNGKSSLGNTLIGKKNVFEEGDNFNAVTTKSQLVKDVDGLAVVDTPGLFDTKADVRKVVSGARSIIKALKLCKNPHAFLIVFNGACRMTEEELSVINVLRLSFGNEWIRHAIVVITHIENDVKDSKFEDKWRTCKQLEEFVKECNGRVARINNKNAREKHIEKILQLIDLVSENGKLSYKYSYHECHKKVLANAEQLENYNGMPAHEIIKQLSIDIQKEVKNEIKRQEDIAKLNAEARRIKIFRSFATMLGIAALIQPPLTVAFVGSLAWGAYYYWCVR